ncbi:MAG: hypothetical protein M9927_03710 [Anaerolineae bacterium]|nr:hypothetical protein [Anaerolineae bacterium]
MRGQWPAADGRVAVDDGTVGREGRDAAAIQVGAEDAAQELGPVHLAAGHIQPQAGDLGRTGDQRCDVLAIQIGPLDLLRRALGPVDLFARGVDGHTQDRVSESGDDVLAIAAVQVDAADRANSL